MFKLKRLKATLNKWNHSIFGNIFENKKRIMDELEVIQNKIGEQGYDDDLFCLEVEKEHEITKIMRREF